MRLCIVCRKLSSRCQRINNGPWHCYDGCFGSTGKDRRTYDGQPAWLQIRNKNGQFGKGKWSKERMIE